MYISICRCDKWIEEDHISHGTISANYCASYGTHTTNSHATGSRQSVCLYAPSATNAANTTIHSFAPIAITRSAGEFIPCFYAQPPVFTAACANISFGSDRIR